MGVFSRMKDKNKTYPFGFADVSREEKDDLVKRVFSGVAGRYDLMNDLMSWGVHRLWKNFMVSQITPHKAMSVLDMAGGTGDIAFRIAEKFPQASITLCDINPEMLEVGKKRASHLKYRKQISWVTGSASNLPFKDNAYEVYTISFGLRNVTDIPAALNEAYRVLKPGGQFLCLEFSQVKLPLLREMYATYSFEVIPQIGKIIAKNKEAYKYLVESIARFPNQQKLENLLKEAHFKHITHINLAGGIAALHMGWKI